MTASTHRGLTSARLVAWTCFLFGTVVSVGFNVLAAFLIPADAAAGWRPNIWTILGAAVWPLMLLGSIELLAGVPWPNTLFARLVRYGAMTVVALFAATISYQHIRSVLLAWRYNDLSSGVGPLVIDGMMIMAGYAMVVISAVMSAKQGGLTSPAPEKKTGNGAITPTRIAKAFDVPEELLTPGHDMGALLSEQHQQEAELIGSVPAQRTNGHRVSAALKSGPKAPARRKTSGQSDEEIVATLREEIERGEGPDLTKRGVMTRFGVGAPRWTKITELLKKEES
jgi:hypothetical protein